MTTARKNIARVLCVAALAAGTLLWNAPTADAAPVTVVAPAPPQAGSSVAGGKSVGFTVFVNAFGGGINVRTSVPAFGAGMIKYQSVVSLTCTSFPPSPSVALANGTGAPQFLNPAAEGDLTLFCPFYFGSLGQQATGNVVNIL